MNSARRLGFATLAVIFFDGCRRYWPWETERDDPVEFFQAIGASCHFSSICECRRLGFRSRAGRCSGFRTSLATATRYPSVDALEQSLGNFDFVPNLSPQSVAGVDIEKNFLLQNGYIAGNFKVEDWVDSRYLEKALAGL